MKMAILRKVMIIPVVGIFLMASSCKAQKQPSEQTEVSQEKAGLPASDEAQQKAPTEQKASAEQKASTEQSKSSPSKTMLIPDFTLQSIRNQKVSLSDFVGNKIILINFWATWCPYCVAEIPHLNKIEKSLSGQVKFLSIDIGEKPEKVQSFAKQKGLLFDVLLDQQGEVARRYRVRGTPTNIVIDKKGDIVYYGYELNKAEQVIMSLLGK